MKIDQEKLEELLKVISKVLARDTQAISNIMNGHKPMSKDPLILLVSYVRLRSYALSAEEEARELLEDFDILKEFEEEVDVAIKNVLSNAEREIHVVEKGDLFKKDKKDGK